VLNLHTARGTSSPQTPNTQHNHKTHHKPYITVIHSYLQQQPIYPTGAPKPLGAFANILTGHSKDKPLANDVTQLGLILPVIWL